MEFSPEDGFRVWLDRIVLGNQTGKFPTVSLPHSIAQIAIEWGTLGCLGHPPTLCGIRSAFH